MSSRKRRAQFNSQWRKDRKKIKAVQSRLLNRGGKKAVTPEDFTMAQSLAAKYDIDIYREKVK
jgi:hypothetical protein